MKAITIRNPLHFAQKVRELRGDLNKKQLEKLIGICDARLDELESPGEVTYIRHSTLEKLCEYKGWSEEYLLGEGISEVESPLYKEAMKLALEIAYKYGEEGLKFMRNTVNDFFGKLKILQQVNIGGGDTQVSKKKEGKKRQKQSAA